MTKRPTESAPGFSLIELMIVVAVIAIIASIAIPSVLRSRVAANEIAAVGTLRTANSDEAIWRQNDTDRNTINDYWTADVSGLYRTESLPAGSGLGVALIDVAVAQSDSNRLNAGAAAAGAPIPGAGVAAASVIPLPRLASKSGYFYRMMSQDAYGAAYALDPDGNGQSWTNPAQFAIQAYPEVYNSTGLNTLIIDSAGIVYGRDFGNASPTNADAWPGANPAVLGWRVVQ